MRSLAKYCAVAAVCAFVPACTSVRSVSDIRAAERAADSAPSIPDQWTSARARVGEVQIGWIDAIGDPILTGLVEEALANNLSLQAAEANVRRSWALARQAGAQQYPFLDVVADADRRDPVEGPGRATTYSAAAAISYEVDIWNRIAAGEAAAIAGAEAADADYLFAQYSIAAAVARSYFLAIEAREQVEVAQNVFDALTEIVRIVNLRYRYGFASAYDVSLAEADLATAADSLANAKNGEIEALRILEALLGRYPAGLLEVATALPVQPAPPGEGLPSQLLERRPDIIAAERNIAATLNSYAQASAARLPSLSLSTAIGGASGELEDVLDPANVVWTLAGNILAPIFRGGALNAAVDVADAEVDAAVALYADAAITAFSEVEAALDRGEFLRERRTSLEASTEQSRNALRLSNLQYQEGEIDLIDVLSIQQRVFGAESALIAIRRAHLNQYLELSLALGGDWRGEP